jgi:hypothetical protein
MFRLTLAGIILVPAMFILSGCFAMVTDQNAIAQAKEPVYCDGADECEIKWHRALNYGSQHSDYRFQTMTDSFAQTPAPRGSTQIATTLRKESLGGGRYRIAIQLVCGNSSIAGTLCESWLLGYIVAFKQSVNAPLPSDTVEATDRPARINKINIGPASSKRRDHNSEKGANNDGSDLDLRIVPAPSD